MGIFQLGVAPKIILGETIIPTYTQMFCELHLPPNRLFESAYVWIGVWTDKLRFMQVGLISMPPNVSLMNSSRAGKNVIAYATDSTYYYLQPFDQLNVNDGDIILLNLQRVENTEDWIIGAVSQTNDTGGICQTYKGVGSSFHISTLKIVFEGYSGILPTKYIDSGEISLKNIWLKDEGGFMHRLSSPQVYSPTGEEYLQFKIFEPTPEWLSIKYTDEEVTWLLS